MIWEIAVKVSAKSVYAGTKFANDKQIGAMLCTDNSCR